MHSTEDCVCGNSVFNRKMELTQSASLASCSSQVLGRLPSPAVNAARWERHSHLSSPRYAGKEHCQKPRQGKGGISEQNGSGWKDTGHWLCHSHSGVRDNFDIKKWALSDQMVHYCYHWAVCCHLLSFQSWQSPASALSRQQIQQECSQCVFLSVRRGWSYFLIEIS